MEILREKLEIGIHSNSRNGLKIKNYSINAFAQRHYIVFRTVGTQLPESGRHSKKRHH